LNGALAMDDRSPRRGLTLNSLPASGQQLLTERNVFRALTLIVFCGVVLSLLFYCDFLPFGTDNNETSSSILHAKNMYLHGIGSAYGLTNEATSPSPDAAPFVYTHQGNFPRFYALLLYVLGATSAEAQILITTFTIGMVSIFFAHIYMERRVNALFAFIFCSVLLTEYIMSLQWLVNTWRVWHFFFFFSTLLLAHAFVDAAGSTSRTMLNSGLLLIDFACLFYFEFIFAMFVAIFFTLYLTFLLWRQPWRLVLGLAMSGIGGVLAVCLLFVQIILYLGWQGFLSDLSYTFFSRNAAPADFAAFRERVLGFMREHNIVFWDNFTTANSGLKTPGEMLRLFFRFNLITQTPMLVLLSLLLTAGAWLHAATVSISQSDRLAWMRRRIHPDNGAALLVPAFVLFGLIVILSGTSYGIIDNRENVIAGSSIRFIIVSLVIASAAVLFMSLYRQLLAKTALSGASEYQRLRDAKGPAAALLVIMTVGGALQSSYPDPSLIRFTGLLAVIMGGAAVLWVISSRYVLSNGRVVLATALLIGFAVFAHYHAWLYQPIHSDLSPNHFEPFWSEVIAKRGGPTFWKLAILATAFLSTLIVLGVTDDANSPRSVANLGRIAPYWLIGMAAYTIVFTIAAGYVYTAYQVRHAPFAVYLSALPGACAIYVLCSLARHLPGQFMDAYRPFAPGRILLATGRAILVCGVLATIAGTWLAVQATYIRRIPPDRVAPMFHALEKIGGASTVVSTYATPVAIRTRQWSYFDPAFFHQGESLNHDGYHVSAQDFRYLWFSDWKSNSAYRTPEYFVCWLHLNFYNVVSPANRWNCGGSLAAVRDIRQGRTVFDHKEVFRDEKYDLWSIIKLDWDYPPYLRPLEEFSRNTEVRSATVLRADGIGFTVEIDPHQQEGRAIMGAHYRLYAEPGDNPTCDVSSRRLIQFSNSPAELLLPKKFKGCVQIGVSPFTATKIGSEHYSEKIVIGGDSSQSGDDGSRKRPQSPERQNVPGVKD
jgi:hypothetical protein